MNKEKIYILQKDLPDTKSGSKYIFNSTYHRYYLDGNVQGSYWDKEWVENNPEWFLPPKEVKHKITTMGLSEKAVWFHIDNEPHTPCVITRERLAEILILESKNELMGKRDCDGNAWYTVKEHLQALEDCWKAAREKDRLSNPCSVYPPDKYKSFSDYMSSKQKQ